MDDARRSTQQQRRRGTEAPRLRAGAAAPHGRVLQFRDLVLDHLHPRGRHHVAPARDLRDRRRRGGHRLARRRRVLADRRAVHGRGRVRVSDRRRALSLELDPRRQGVGLGDRLVQPGRPRVRDRGRQRRRVRPVRAFRRTDGRASIPTQPRHGPPDRGRRADLAVARAAESLRDPRDDAAHRLFRLVDLRRRALADGRDAARRAVPRDRPPVHLRRQRRRGGRRRLAGGAGPRER